jgi:hypothetical protein
MRNSSAHKVRGCRWAWIRCRSEESMWLPDWRRKRLVRVARVAAVRLAGGHGAFDARFASDRAGTRRWAMVG